MTAALFAILSPFPEVTTAAASLSKSAPVTVTQGTPCDKKGIIYCDDINASSMKKLPFSRKSPGFTLVEVCLSMAIMTVTLVPLLGLMANGLTQVGSNIDKNQAVNICQQVYVAAQQQSFSNLVSAAGTSTPASFYFTAEGDPVTTAGSANIVYTAIVTYTTNQVTAPTPPLVTLAIKILKTPGGAAGTSNPVASFVGTVSCPDISGYNAGTD
jgi:uncharacterized protein (TIGR02598 family)